MGAEVIIFGQSLNSQFPKGLTHSALNDRELPMRLVTIEIFDQTEISCEGGKIDLKNQPAALALFLKYVAV